MARTNRRGAWLAAVLLLAATVMVPQMAAAGAGQWTWVYPRPQGSDLLGIAYGEGEYVAVGEAGTILTSIDGVQWRLRPTWTRESLAAVAAGNGRFVAVGAHGTIMTSTDGSTWISARSGIDAFLSDVVYGEQGFVAVGTGGVALVSADGLHWEATRTGAAKDLGHVAYGNGLYVAVGAKGTLARSTDGVNWQLYNAGGGDDLTGVEYGNGQFLLFGYNGGVDASSDAIAWTYLQGDHPSFWLSAAYGGGRFVGDTGRELLWSENGVQWHRADGESRGGGRVGYGPAGFLFVGSHGEMMFSPSGERWRSLRVWEQPALKSVQFAGELFFGTSRSLLGGAVLYTSPDGLTWTRRSTYGVSAILPQQIIRPADWYVGVGDGRAWLSQDGITWTDSGASLRNATGLAYGNGRFVAAGSDWAVSLDGLTWKVLPAETDLTGLAYGNGLFVATGKQGTIYTSKDGITWDGQTQSDGFLAGIAFGNGRFVAVGPDGALLASVDGLTWDASIRSEAVFRSPSQVLFAEGQFLVAGFDGALLTSPDGVTWRSHQTAVGQVSQVVFGNGRYLVLAGDRMLMLDGSLANPCGARFADVPESYPACRAAESLAAGGVVAGYPDGLFRPEQPVTRAEFAKLLVLALGEQPQPDGALPFADAADHWVAKQGYLQPAFRMKAITGFPDGTARPDEPLTRAQAVKILMAARPIIGIFPPGGAEPYVDMKADQWYAPFAQLARTRRLIGPAAPTPIWDGPLFREGDPVIRAEAAILIDNLLLLTE